MLLEDACDQKIFEVWMACHSMEEIAAECGCSVQPVKDVVSDIQSSETKNPKPAANHLTDFTPPLYNIWKQQEKTPGSTHFGNTQTKRADTRRHPLSWSEYSTHSCAAPPVPLSL